MKTVHIIGAGGPAGVGLSRCLKEYYDVMGSDDSAWSRLMMECRPPRLESAAMAIALPDSLMHRSSFWPGPVQLLLCQDKAKCAEALGNLAPKTYWVRDTHGAGGAGAQMQSEYLPGKNYSVEFVYKDGQELTFFMKERISYSVKEKTEGLGNRGSSAVSVCRFIPSVIQMARIALDRIAGQTNTSLNGFYGVDLKCDAEGGPRVTEINAGRLLTASYAFFHETGYNLPLVGVKAFLGEELPVLPDYPAGWGQIRQVGQLPRMFPPEVTKEWK